MPVVRFEPADSGGGGTDDQTAAEVPFTPAGDVASTDVQSAIAEVESDAAAARVTDAATAAAATVAAALVAADGTADATSFIRNQGSAVLYVRADEHDVEQDYFPNLIESSDVMGALPGAEAPTVFVSGSDFYDGFLYLDQIDNSHSLSGLQTVSVTGEYCFEIDCAPELLIRPGLTQRLLMPTASTLLGIDSSGKLSTWDGGATHTAASTVATLLGVSDGDRFEVRLVSDGVDRQIDCRVPGGSWVGALTTTGGTEMAFNASSFRVGSSGTPQAFKGRIYGAKLRDGASGTSPVVSWFDPDLFVAGNRGDADTYTDSVGGVWLLGVADVSGDSTRPKVASAESLSLPGVTANYVTVAPAVSAGALDVQVDVDTWTTDDANSVAVIGQWGSGQKSWLFATDAGSDNFRYYTSSDGTTTGANHGTTESVAAHRYWRHIKSGVNGTFYYSDDGVTYTQDTTYGSLPATLHNSTTDVLAYTQNGGWYAEVTNRKLEVYLADQLVARLFAGDADVDADSWVDPATGHTVTVTRSATSKAAVVGGAVWQFQGAERLMVPHSALLDLDASEGLTVVARVRSHSGGGGWGRIVAKNNTGTDHGWYLAKSAAGARIYSHMNDATSSVDVGALADNVTYGDVFTVASAWDSSGSEIYIDGVSEASDSTVLVDVTGVKQLAIGSANDGGNPSVVEIESVAVFNSRLSAVEVAEVHNELAGLTVESVALAAADVSFAATGTVAATDVQAAVAEVAVDAAALVVAAAAVAAADTDAEAVLAAAATADATSFIHTQGSAVLYVRADDYDSEQDYYPNSIVGSDVMGALPGAEAPIVFETDSAGEPYVFLDQLDNAQYFQSSTIALTSTTAYSVEGSAAIPDLTPAAITRLFVAGNMNAHINTSGQFGVWDGVGGSTASSTMNTLIGVGAGEVFEYRVQVSGTSLDVDVRVPGGSWTAAIGSATMSASPALTDVYVGSSITTQAFLGRYYWLRVRDGATATSPVVALFDPAGFPAGNRADADTWVDLGGNTWTLSRADLSGDATRPELKTDIGGMSGVDTDNNWIATTSAFAMVANSDVEVRISIDPDDWTPTGTQRLFNHRVFCSLETDGDLAFSYADTVGAFPGLTMTSHPRTGPLDIRFTLTDDTNPALATYYRVYDADVPLWDDTGWVAAGTTTSTGGSISLSSVVAKIGYNTIGFVGTHRGAILYENGGIRVALNPADADPDSSTFSDAITGTELTITRATSGNKLTIIDEAKWLFDSSTYLTVPHHNSLNLDASVGLTAVILGRMHTGGGDWARLFMKYESSGPEGWFMAKYGANPRVYSYIDDDVSIVNVGDGSDNITYGDVFSVATAWSAAGSETYVDGVSNDTDTTALVDSGLTGDMRIGEAVLELEAAVVFADRLTDAEVLAVHNELRGIVEVREPHHQVCTAATRPASPRVGDSIYESDTLRSRTWDGTYWLEMDGPIRDYTPSIESGLTLGNGTLTGKYFLKGWELHWWIQLTWGSTTSATNPQFNTPGTMTVDGDATVFYVAGQAIARESGVGWHNGNCVSYDAADDILNTATFFDGVDISATVPFTWGENDRLVLSGVYVMDDVDAPTS